MPRKSKKKSTKAKSGSKPKTRKPKEMSDIEKLKKMESDLHVSCMSDIDNIVKQYNMNLKDGQTRITDDEILDFIEKNGIEKVKVINGFQMAEPLYELMVKNWKTMEQVSVIRQRAERANRKLFLVEMEKMASDLDEKVQKIEEEEKFYTTQPDIEGKVHLKEKWFSEMEYWTEQLAKAKTPEQYKKAQAEIKKLNQKKKWMHTKNLMPNISKWMGKITKGINTVQDSMGEISKPFQQMGDSYGFDQASKSKGNANDFGFNEKSVFSGVPESGFGEKKKKKSDDFFGGF